MQEGGQEGGESCRKEDKREGSHAGMIRSGRGVVQNVAEGRESCREEEKREGSHAERSRGEQWEGSHASGGTEGE
jgi:hypothetical protein